MQAADEREWWDAHAEPIYVWGEDDDGAWDRSVSACLPLVCSGLWGDHGALGVRGPVLDLGCGLGRLALPLAQMFPAVEFIGVDVSPEMLLKAEILKAEAAAPNVHFRLGDGRRLPRELAPFRAAFSVLLFQHIPAEAVRTYIFDVAAALEPGARFLVQYVTTCGARFNSAGSFLSWAHSPDRLEAWGREAGLVTVSHQSGLVYPEWVWTTMEKPA